jgi:calcineurin-like phosphoesterase family protein
MDFLTSDTHFNHEKIIEFCSHDIKTADEMNWAIVKIWNATVSPTDRVFHFGDFAFKTGQKKEETRNLFHNLNGEKHLLIGNHDNIKQIGDFGWASIKKEDFIVINGVKFRMAHFPYLRNMQEKDKKERPECFTPDVINPETNELYPLLHGHVHESYALKPYGLNVGWDIFHKPITDDRIFEIYQETNGFKENVEKVNKILYNTNRHKD